MIDTTKQLNENYFPPLLSETNDPPKKLFYAGKIPDWSDYKILCVVGSRKNSSYGKMVCHKLIASLRGKKVIIVSGLALGTDAYAHQEALSAGLIAVAVPGSGLNPKVLAPKTNFGLAKEILRSGGMLMSEYEPDFKATPWSFPKRNSTMAGMSHATLLIEAGEKSGTLITARLAMEYNRDVLVVPGSIFSETSKGSNQLLRDGATPITCVEDLHEALGIQNQEKIEIEEIENCSIEEEIILKLLSEPRDRNFLLEESGLNVTNLNANLSLLEIKGYVKEAGGKINRIA
jgi:DNA processing protein